MRRDSKDVRASNQQTIEAPKRARAFTSLDEKAQYQIELIKYKNHQKNLKKEAE